MTSTMRLMLLLITIYKAMVYKQLYPIDDFKNGVMLINADKNLEELKRIEKEHSEGLLYRWWKEPYADGNIFYQVINVYKRTCNVLICEGICLDVWKKGEHEFMLEYVESMIKRRDALEQLFSKK